MNTKVIPFPKELRLHFFRDIDKEFLYIIIACYAVTIVGCIIMMNVKLPGITDAEADEMLAHLAVVSVDVSEYNLPAPQKTIQYKNQSDNSPTNLDENKGDANGNISKEQSKFRKQRAANTQEVDRVISVLRNAPIFQAIGRNGNGFHGGNNSFGGGVQASGSGDGFGNKNGSGGALQTISPGIDLNQINSIVVSEHEADIARKLRAGGKLNDNQVLSKSHATLSELREIPIDVILERAKVMTKNSIRVFNPNSKQENARSKAEVNNLVNSHANEIRSCFQQYLRRDPNLSGNITLSFTILTNGAVADAKIIEREWTDNNLGRLVENSICERIQTWRFATIGKSGGDSTICSLSYVFSR